MRSSFTSFTTALLGMRASQYALDITGHNISNINTTGYTRQRTDQYAMALTGGGYGNWEARIGMGVNISGVSQVRDPYLDVRFRNEVAQVGYTDATLAGLEGLESILDEVGTDGLDAGIISQFDDFAKQLAALASDVNSRELENLVRASADTLTKFLNQYAKKIEIARADTEENFQSKDVPQLNDILKSIQNLTESIESNQANGNPSLELLDERNLLIDQLANHMKIDVKYTTKKIAGTDRTIDQLNIDFVTSTGEKIRLIEGAGDAAQFESKVVNGKMTLSVTPCNPKIPADALGGYPPLKESAITANPPDDINSILQKIADFNNDTTTKYQEIQDKETAMTEQWALVTEAKKALAAAGPDDDKEALQGEIETQTGKYEKLKEERNDLQKELTQQKKDRYPALQELQKLLPDVRFKESEGSMTVTYTYAKKNYTLVDGQNIATFSTGTDGDRKSLLLTDAITSQESQIGKFPNVSSANVKTVNATLKKMQQLEEKITTALGDNPGVALNNNEYMKEEPAGSGTYVVDTDKIEQERNALLADLQAAMPNARIDTSDPRDTTAPFQVKYTENGTEYLLIEGDIPPAQFNITNNSLMLNQANPAPDPKDVTDVMSEGSLLGTMDLLNCSGLFDADAKAPRGFGYYSKMLDSLAITMANTFNEANKLLTDGDGNPIKDKNGNTIGGDMFGSNDGDPISAKNICIAAGWASGDHGLVATRSYQEGDDVNTGLADNLLHMQNLLTNAKTGFSKVPVYVDQGQNPNVDPTPDLDPGDIAFSGTFRECFENIGSLLGTDIKTNQAILDNHVTVANDISNNIDQMSGVSLDEEGVNMMRYQKSLTAAMRFMTTLDEALNSIINNMGLVGR